MNTIDFAREAYKSAVAYLKYARTHQRGLEQIRVLSVEERGRSVFSLRLSKKLYQTDGIIFILPPVKGVYSYGFTEEIRMIEYNHDNPTLTVWVSPELYDDFSVLEAHEILLASDLTFLIERVRDWYTAHHRLISYPPDSYHPLFPLDFSVPYASEEQISAIRTVLESPLSYIWGPPGTGKTKVVLAEAIHYLMQEDDTGAVLVVCPTNHAVEHCLEGILQMRKEQGLSEESVLRLGQASTAFSLSHPSLCEHASLSKEILRLGDQLTILNKQMEELRVAKRLTAHKETILALYDTLRHVPNKERELSLLCSELKEASHKHDETILEARSNLSKANKRVEEMLLYAKVEEAYRAFLPIFASYQENRSILADCELTCSKKKSELAVAEGRLLKTQRILAEKQILLSEAQKKAGRFGSRLLCRLSSSHRRTMEGHINEKQDAVTALEDRIRVEGLSVSQAREDYARAKAKLEGSAKKTEAIASSLEKEARDRDLPYKDAESFLAFCGEMLRSPAPTLEQTESAKAEAERHRTLLMQTETLKANTDQSLQQVEENLAALGEETKKAKDSLACLLQDCISPDYVAGEDMGEALVRRLLPLGEDPTYARSLAERLSLKEGQLRSLEKLLSSAIKEKRIIACTADHLLLRFAELKASLGDRLRHVFLDEAAYCSMIKAAPLFAMGVPVALLGDHMQLPPICEMEDRGDVRSSEDLSFLWSQSSLYFPDIFAAETSIASLRSSYREGAEPLFTKVKRAALSVTYRFGKNLAAILDHHVYGTGFVGKAESTELVIIDAPRPTNEEQLRENHAEIKAICAYLTAHKGEDIAVLTPYKKQRDLLAKATGYRLSDILTIHAAQGREWDTVIISVVDTKHMFFTDSTNPRSKGLKILNTAISRAKKKLILVCDRTFWQSKAPIQLIGSLATGDGDVLI